MTGGTFQRWDRRRLLRVAAALPLAGCGPVSRLVESPEPPNLFQLTPATEFAAGLPRVEWQLLVETPIANTAIDTPRIALSQTANQMTYYQGASWVDSAPQMIQLLLVESFENSNRIVSVGREATGLRADFVLKSDLRDFQIVTTAKALEAHVRMAVKLVRMPRRNIVATDNFDAQVAAAGAGFGDIVQAFDKALDAVMRRAVEWTLRQGAANLAKDPPVGG